MTFKLRDELALDEIDLSDLGFWVLPDEVREGALSKLRSERPVAHFDEPTWSFDENGRGYYAITRYEDVVAVSRDPKTFCSGRGSVSIPDLPEEFVEFFGSLINTDDPRHGYLRRVVSAAFTPKRLGVIEGRIATLARDLVGRFRDDGGGDFVGSVASQLPLSVICEMMGVPKEREQFVLERSNLILGALDEDIVPPERSPDEAILTAAVELTALMEEIAQERLARPTDDITSALVQGSVDGESLTSAELASFFILLVVAGNETTRNAISHGLVALKAHPSERELWATKATEVTPTAVEEVVRWASPVTFMRRTAVVDTEVRGVEISAGEKVLLMYGSANRDEEVFDQPYRFDLRRSPNRHVGFGGYGPHYCLGAHLARREIGAVFQEILLELPDFDIVGEPSRLSSNFINGIKRLEVRS